MSTSVHKSHYLGMTHRKSDPWSGCSSANIVPLTSPSGSIES